MLHLSAIYLPIYGMIIKSDYSPGFILIPIRTQLLFGTVLRGPFASLHNDLLFPECTILDKRKNSSYGQEVQEVIRTDIVKYNTHSEKSMQKWEYKILQFSISQELPPENYLNQLGEQGWKISASGGMARNPGGHGWIILMREKI